MKQASRRALGWLPTLALCLGMVSGMRGRTLMNPSRFLSTA